MVQTLQQKTSAPVTWISKRGSRRFWAIYFAVNLCFLLLTCFWTLVALTGPGPYHFVSASYAVLSVLNLGLHIALLSPRLEKTFLDRSRLWRHVLLMGVVYFLGLYFGAFLGVTIGWTPEMHTAASAEIPSIPSRVSRFLFALYAGITGFEMMFVFLLTMPVVKPLFEIKRGRLFTIIFVAVNIVLASGTIQSAFGFIVAPYLPPPASTIGRHVFKGWVVLYTFGYIVFIALRAVPLRRWISEHPKPFLAVWGGVLLLAAVAFYPANPAISLSLLVGSSLVFYAAISRQSLLDLLLNPIPRTEWPISRRLKSSLEEKGIDNLWIFVVLTCVALLIFGFIAFIPLPPPFSRLEFPTYLSLFDILLPWHKGLHIYIPPFISLWAYIYSLFFMFLCCWHFLRRTDASGELVPFEERKNLASALLPRLPIVLSPVMMLITSVGLVMRSSRFGVYSFSPSDLWIIAISVLLAVMHYAFLIHLPYMLGQRAWKRFRLAQLKNEEKSIETRMDELKSEAVRASMLDSSVFAEYVQLDTRRQELPIAIKRVKSMSVHPYSLFEAALAFVRSNIMGILLFVLSALYLVYSGKLFEYLKSISAGDVLAFIRLILDLFK